MIIDTALRTIGFGIGLLVLIGLAIGAYAIADLGATVIVRAARTRPAWWIRARLARRRLRRST